MIHLTNQQIKSIKQTQQKIVKRSSIELIFKDLYTFLQDNYHSESISIDFAPIDSNLKMESYYLTSLQFYLDALELKGICNHGGMDYAKLYAEYYHKIDYEGQCAIKRCGNLWKRKSEALFIASVNNKRDGCPEYLHDACIPNSVVYNAGFAFMLTPFSMLHVALGRSLYENPYSKNELFQLGQVGQTFMNATRNLLDLQLVQRQNQKLKTQVAFFEEALQISKVYLFLFSEDLKILFMTPMATRLLEEWSHIPFEKVNIHNIWLPSPFYASLKNYIDHSKRNHADQLDLLSHTIQLLPGNEYDISITTILPEDNTDNLLCYMVRLQPLSFGSKLSMIRQKCGLSYRETEVLRNYLISGLSSKDLSQIMNISAYTINDHFQNILFKCRLQSRKQLHLLIQ